MITMRQPFFSIATAIIFASWGLFHAIRSVYEWQIVVYGWTMPVSLSWAISGLMFLMAYFALAHLKHK